MTSVVSGTAKKIAAGVVVAGACALGLSFTLPHSDAKAAGWTTLTGTGATEIAAKQNVEYLCGLQNRGIFGFHSKTFQNADGSWIAEASCYTV